MSVDDHPDRRFARDMERAEEERRREEERDRAERHASALLDPAGEVGAVLYKRAKITGDVEWEEMSQERRAVWAQAEQHLRSRLPQLAKPGPLRVHGPETAVERYERHVEAVEAVLTRTMLADVDPSGLRELAEEVLAAAETGI